MFFGSSMCATCPRRWSADGMAIVVPLFGAFPLATVSTDFPTSLDCCTFLNGQNSVGRLCVIQWHDFSSPHDALKSICSKDQPRGAAVRAQAVGFDISAIVVLINAL